MDLPWKGPYGILDGQLSARTQAFLAREGHRFSSAFVSWQPRDRGVPRLEDVEGPFEAYFSHLPGARRCLHQTAFNLAGTGYDRQPLIDFTNALIERFGFAWVNEDLGCWSVDGWSLPYPQAPFHTAEAVQHCAAVCREVDEALLAPLVVEFPGYETVPEGDLDAYDFFRQVVERAGCACNLDTGHLLTWRWLCGHRGEDLLGGLERLPLEHTIELHCAGVIETGDKLIDAHHGVLSALQLQLVQRLTALCPNLRVVTYEDPRFDAQGRLPAPAASSLAALESVLEGWHPAPERDLPGPRTQDEPLLESPWEAALVQGFLGEDTSWRAPLATRSTRGMPRPEDLYGSLEDDTLLAFLRSDEGRSWSDFAWAVPGRALEDALGCFLERGSARHLTAGMKLLTLHPDPPFDIPYGFRKSGRSWIALDAGAQPMLYATSAGKMRTGPITPLIAAVLQGERPVGCEPVVSQLQKLGMLD